MTVEDVRDHLKPDEVFYADEFNVSWLPTLKAMGSPKGQRVMIPTPGQPNTHYCIGAVNDHTVETAVIVRRHKRRQKSPNSRRRWLTSTCTRLST
jgi:hypothetical protein